MIDGADLPGFIAAYGLAVLAPLSVLEGPVVTLIAGWLSSLGLLPPLGVFLCVVLGDLVGDALAYAAGRGLRLDRLPLVGRFFRIPRVTLVPLVRAVRANGVRLLVLGKLTHAAGLAVLLAAGAARMPFGLFLVVNLLAGIPKSAALMGLGYALGEAHERIADWISYGSAALAGLLLTGGAVWWIYGRKACK